MNELTRYIIKIAMLIVLQPLRLLPTIKNRVIMDNCLAHNYSDNIKPIAEYLLNNYPKTFEIYICVLDKNIYSLLSNKGLKPIRFHSIKYYIVAMTSKFFITNSGGYSYLPLKKDQVVINTWHGGGAYKKFGMDSYSADRHYARDLRLAAKKTTLFISTCKVATSAFSKALLIPEQNFWEIGMPRNDILIQKSETITCRVRKKIGLKEGKKLVLFAPTYRKDDDYTFGEPVAIEYGIDAKRVCRALETRFGGEWVFGIRMHPTIKNTGEYSDVDILSLSTYDDMQELLLVADVMINDFSSSIWDFMLTRKPCFIFAKDLKHYIETTSLYTPVSMWPFPKATTNDELEKNILNFDMEQYLKDCDKHYTDMGGTETGKSAELISKKMIELIGLN